MNWKSRDRFHPPLLLGARSEQNGGAAEELELHDDHQDGFETASTPSVKNGETIESMLEPAVVLPTLDLDRPAGETASRESKPVKAAKGKKAKPEDLTELAPIAEAQPAVDGAKAKTLPVWARLAYPAAFALAALWAGPMIAFSASYQSRFGAFEYRPFPVIVFSALAILPAVFLILGAYVLRQAAKLSLETRRARDLADELAIPAALAVDHAGGAADAVRREVARATEAGEAAERQLLSLRQALAEESERLIAATGDAERTAKALTESLARERAELEALTAGLDGQVAAVNDAIGRQTQMVVETSDLAATQLQEAEAALAARATDLAAAAGEAGEAAELAGEALSRQAERLETAGELVGSRLQALNENLGRGHSRLADLAVQLQADQQALSERLEAQRLSAVAAASEAQEHVAAATEGAAAVAASLRDLIAEADARLRSVAEDVQGEQAALDARARASLALFRDAVSEERAGFQAEAEAAQAALETRARNSLSEFRETVSHERAAIEAEAQGALASLHQTAAASHDAATASAEAARVQIEQLGEAAFAAAQRADQAFDSRISAARRAIEQSAALVEEAGDRSVGRIDAGLAAAREALRELESMLAAVDSRIATVPAEAKAKADMVQAAVESGLADITASAKKVMADSEAVDGALQERVRRNYAMLSEALTAMGKVAAVTEQAARSGAFTPPPAPAQAAPPSAPAQPTPAAAPTQPPVSRIVQAGIARPLPASSPAAAAFAERAIRIPAAAPTATPAEPALRPAALAPAASPAPPVSAGDIGLRPRLRLTPEAPPTPQPIAAERPAPKTFADLEAFTRAAGRPATTQPPADAPRDTSAWTWKDLLSSIDEPPIDDEVLAERLISEIETLGLDAATLLPLSQIDAIAVAMKRGDVTAVREAVRSLAPGAVRRLSRRVLTDKVLRAQADRYVRRYEDLLNDSARRDQEGFMTAALLGSDPGRAFLLFDAAVGELH